MTIQIRYIIYGLSTSCITLLYALRLAFHSTIICQINNSTDSFLIDDNLRQYTFQSVGLGLAIGIIPLHFLNFLGTRKVTIIYGIVGIISACLYPTAHYYGFYTSFFVRLIQGAPLGILLWLVAKVAGEWSPKTETAMAIAVLTSVYQLAPFVAQITAAEMCQSVGWEYTYYTLAAMCALSHFGFYLIYSDKVEDNCYTTEKEKHLINQYKPIKQSSDKDTTTIHSPVPYSQLLQDSTVWATWFANFAFFSSLLVFLQYGPGYMFETLGFSLRVTGYSGGFAHILCLVVKVIFGKVIDGIDMDMTKKLKMAWTAIEVPSLLLMVSLIFIHESVIQLISIVLFIAIHGVAIVIIVKTQTFRSGEHNHVLANGNTICVVISLFLQPPFVKLLVQSNTLSEWSIVFAFHSLLIFISIIFFVFKVDATIAPWATAQVLPTNVGTSKQ